MYVFTEFGIGFPPRIFGIWRGRTVIRIDSLTHYDEGNMFAASGKVMKILAIEKKGEVPRAVWVGKERTSGAEYLRYPDVSSFIGLIREVHKDHVVIADMRWSLNLLPIGGFVRMTGEENPSSPTSLAALSPLKRIAVIGAGIFVNMLIPFILLPVVLLFPRDMEVGDVFVDGVLQGSPAQEAGVMRGDKILTVDGKPIDTVRDLQLAVISKAGEQTIWELERGDGSSLVEQVELVPRSNPPQRIVVERVEDPGSEISLQSARSYNDSLGLNNTLTVVNEVSDTLIEISVEDADEFLESPFVGDIIIVVSMADEMGEVSLERARDFNSALGVATEFREGPTGILVAVPPESVRRERVADNPVESIIGGWDIVVNDIIVGSAIGFYGIVVGSSDSGTATSSPVLGPVGLGQLTGELATISRPISDRVIALAILASALSLSLGIVNLLPIPALDGGRILFILIEILRGGRRISPRVEAALHTLGFIILIVLIFFVAAGDVSRILNGETFF